MHILVEIRVDGGRPDAELITDRLWHAGAVGVEERPGLVIAAFDNTSAATTTADEFGATIRTVTDSTGLDGWRPYAEVHSAGPFTIRAPWHEPGPGVDLVIDPGHSFGSGSHPSTRLAIEALALLVEPGMHVVDLGSGSGVLAIAAALLGARATAIDIDPGSSATITANAERNGVAARVETSTADIATVSTCGDLAVLNVTIDIHEQVAAGLHSQRIETLVAAGLLAGPQEDRAAAAHRRTISHRIVDGEWAALVLGHGPAAAPS